MEKAIGYIRVSTLTQVKGHSLSYQEDAIKKYCESKDMSLEKVFIDKGLSGYKHRPEYNKMKEYLEKNKDIKYLITYSITRFGRSTADLLISINELDSRGISFISIKESVDISTKTGRLLLGMLALIADFEAETIKERMVAGREWAIQHGTKSGKPIGHPKAVIDWDLVKDRRSHGYSFNKIAKEIGVSVPTLTKHAKEEGVE